MSLIDGLKTLGSTVSKFAPLLGGAIAGPGGAAIATLISSAFNGETDPEKLASTILANPTDAQVKLVEIQTNHKLELEKLQVNQAIAQTNADLENTKSAREMNIKNEKKVDEYIKVLLVVSIVAVMFYGMYLIQELDIDESEADIVKVILGADLTSIATIVGFYFGAAYKGLAKQ